MADIVTQFNIGAYAVPVSAVRPQSASAGIINGSTIDRFAHGTALSCVLFQNVGVISGSPTASTVQATLQHSPDGSTWTNYAPSNQNGAAQQTAVIAAGSSDSNVAINLSSAYRFVRAVTVVGFTGGTTPAVLVAATLVLGGEQTLPAV